MALVAFNILSTVKSALKEVHGTEKIDAELSIFHRTYARAIGIEGCLSWERK